MSHSFFVLSVRPSRWGMTQCLATYFVCDDRGDRYRTFFHRSDHRAYGLAFSLGLGISHQKALVIYKVLVIYLAVRCFK